MAPYTACSKPINSFCYLKVLNSAPVWCEKVRWCYVNLHCVVSFMDLMVSYVYIAKY